MLPDDLVAELTREPAHALAVSELVLAEHAAEDGKRHLPEHRVALADLAAAIRAANTQLGASPLRRLEATPHLPARGLRAPDGGIVTWRSDQPTALDFAAMEAAVRFTPHAATRFTIRPVGTLADADGRRLRSRERRSLARALVVAYCEQRYITSGYLNSGFIERRQPHHCAVDQGTFDEALASLVANGQLQRRHCQAISYQLAPSLRAALVDAHGLAKRWRETGGAGFDCEGPWGEITFARREAHEERADVRRRERRVFYPGERGGQAREGQFATQLALLPARSTLTLELALALNRHYEADGNLEQAFRALPVASTRLLALI